MLFLLNRKVVLTAAVAMASQVSFVHAAGYGINEQSASYLGTGFAGRASNAIDASISATNPAGISFLKGTQVSVGTDVILEGGSFEGERETPIQGGSTSGKTDDFQQTSFVPFGYFTMPINDQLNFGLAGYAPYGIHLDYKDGWAGEWLGGKTIVEVVNLQGTASYKFTDDFAVGFGLIGSHLKGELTSKPFGKVDAKIKGDDSIIAWNIGALWQVNPSTSIGVAYHSKLDFSLDGTYSPIMKQNQTGDAALNIVMPEKLMLSGTHKLDDRWTVMADATWTKWSRFKEFNVTDAKSGESVNYVPMNWKDTWALSLGTSYQLDDYWLLRAGYMFDQSPVSDDNRTVRSPDADRNWLTFGANLKASENLSVDFAYAYVKLKDGKINEKKHSKSADESDAAYGVVIGNYKSSSHVVGLQLNYTF